MIKAKKFLDLCNELSDVLIETHQLPKHQTLGQAIRQTRFNDPVIKRFYELLIDITELRNVLVHNTHDMTYLAEPNDHVIKTLEHVINHIKKPKRIRDYALSKTITLDMSMSLVDVLGLIKDTRFSHFPVYDNHTFKGILTDNGIVHYMADHMHETLDYSRIQVMNLMDEDDHKDHVLWVDQYTKVLDLMDILSMQSHIKVILIKNQPESNAKDNLKGLLLPKDILKMLEDIMKVGKSRDRN